MGWVFFGEEECIFVNAVKSPRILCGMWNQLGMRREIRIKNKRNNIKILTLPPLHPIVGGSPSASPCKCARTALNPGMAAPQLPEPNCSHADQEAKRERKKERSPIQKKKKSIINVKLACADLD